MARRLTCLTFCALLTLLLCLVQFPIAPVVGNDATSAHASDRNSLSEVHRDDATWIKLLIQNANALEQNLTDCVELCDHTIRMAEEAGEGAVVAVAHMQRACAIMGLWGIERSDRDFQTALRSFPDHAEGELRLLFTEALCFHEQHTAPRHTALLPAVLKRELGRLSNSVAPALRLHALCDLLSWSTLDGEHCQEALIAAQALVRNAERPDLKIRLEYLALKHDLQRESGNEENRIRPLVEALLTQPGFSSLPRSLKIEILMFNSDLQMRGGDRHAAIECLNLAQSEARLLQDKTVIASCEAQLSAMTPSGSEFQFAFCERQAAAGALISAINDVNVLHLLSRQLSDERCTVSLRSETARQLGARLITLKTQANLSADEVTRRLSSRDSYYLTKQSEQLFAERTRADSESHWSLMVTRIGLVVFCGLAFVLFRDRWHLRQANRRLQSEIARNEQQHLEKERMELRLAKTERLESLGALAGGIAHDFSNLLVGVIGNADLLKHLEPASPMANQCLDGIIRSAETAADLSRKMLAYAGKEVAKKRVIDLNGLIARMLPLLQAGVGGRHAIKFSPASECLPTEADSGQLEQILLNLVTNASQAIGGNHGKITIKSGVVTLENIPVEVPTFGNRKSGGTFVWFEVSDTGPGIPESHLGRVFEPFFTTKQQSAGHGFGLAVVYGHVNRHDGLIQLQTSPGNGTSLRILLPYSSELVSNDATPIMDPLVTTVSEGLTVVAVDDQVEVLDVIQRTLAACRVKIIGFLTATEALEFLSENNSIDCILLDMVMPIVDGTAMLEALSQRGNVVPVVIMSGYSSRNLEDFPGLPGVSAVLQKPFRPGDLVKAICSAIPPERRTIRLDVSQLQKSHP